MPVALIYPSDNCLEERPEPQYTEKSLGFVSIHWPIRQILIKTVSSGSKFDNIILAVIALNTICMACVDYSVIDENYAPSSNGSVRNSIIEIAEVFFLVIFFIEFIVKAVAFGLVSGPEAYLKKKENMFDALILLTRCVQMISIKNKMNRSLTLLFGGMRKHHFDHTKCAECFNDS